jgi:hypothetical protein
MTEKALLEKARKTPNGIVKVSSRPSCDFCKSEAVIDGKTRLGPWAYMCPLHFAVYGVGLGLGKGQFLLVEEK